MSLKRNLVANYLSQTYVTFIGIIMVPLYIKYMGSEAYGLVGFFAMLQAWFSLLDMGLTGTMARESARFHGGAMEPSKYRRLLRSLEWIFLAIAVVGGLSLFAASNYIAVQWLQASQLPVAEVQGALQLMAVIVAVRWMGGLYRGTISGAERLVWLGSYTSLMATFRFVGVLPVLLFLDASPRAFFNYQMILAALEFMGLLTYAYQLIPDLNTHRKIPWTLEPLKPIIKFSMTIAFTSSVWILSTQTDKLLLSRLLSLAEYGYFTLAVLVAGSVTLISAPVSLAIMPRMARLEAEGDHEGLIRIYRQSTQLVAIFSGAASITLAFCATPLLWAWTGDLSLAKKAAPILILYALGNGVLAVSAFPYYLQYAKGNLRLHLIGNILFVVFLIPPIVWATTQFGGVGAGYVWLGINLLSFIIWLPFVHNKFEPGLNRTWYSTDVLRIFIAVACAGFILSLWNLETDSRSLQLVGVAAFGLLLTLVGALASTAFWAFIKRYLART